MAGGIKLTAYARGYFAASQRTRWVLIVITIASIIAIAASWNTGEHGWIDVRLKAAKEARELLLSHRGPDRRIARVDPTLVTALNWLRVNNFILPSDSSLFGVEPMICTAAFVDSGFGAGAHVRKLELLAVDHAPGRLRLANLEAYIEALERIRLENLVLLDVPFLGIHFDVNDLGIVSGIALSLLLLMLAFSARRELEAARSCFQSAALAERLGEMYDLLSMAEVISQPRDYQRTHPDRPRSEQARQVLDLLARRNAGRRIWRLLGVVVPAILGVAPLIVQGVIFSNDWVTRWKANFYPDKDIPLLLILEVVSMQIMAILAGLAFWQLWQKRQLWTRVHDILSVTPDAPPPEPAQRPE